MTENSYQSHYIPNTSEERAQMLKAVGVASVDQLFADIPASHRNPSLDLPPPMSELEVRRELASLAAANQDLARYACFLGAGAYNHYIPSIIRPLVTRGEFLTSYTPYQPEVSQGTLQATYEFQSLVCQLLGMEVANAGMYDGATALAEGALMACRVTGRGRVAALDTLSPTYREVLETYTRSQGIDIVSLSPGRVQLPTDTACLVAQSPNFFGYLEDLASLAQATHGAGALLVVSTDPVACALFKPPGAYGADVATAEGQPLGLPVSFGGPYVGLFTAKETFLRQMPGRIVGKTVDHDGREAFVLTLQTREQHIRRERATSNICTSQSLMALGVTIYLSVMGPRGLHQVAEQCYHKAHYAASLISKIRGYSLPIQGTFFQEFVVRCPASPSLINQRLLEENIIGGLDVSDLVPNSMLLCVTEMNTREEIERLVSVLKAI